MKTEIVMSDFNDKKHVTRFDTNQDDAPVTNVYVARWWVAQNNGCPNGVRVTIEPIE